MADDGGDVAKNWWTAAPPPLPLSFVASARDPREGVVVESSSTSEGEGGRDG